MNYSGNRIIVTDYARLFVSEDGGTTWAETRPAGDNDRHWQSCSMNDNGCRMIVSIESDTNGRLYVTNDFGTTWTETRPVGDTNEWWSTVCLSGNGLKLGAAMSDGNSGEVYIGDA